MWLLAVGCGMVVGKIIIHGIILSRFLRLKMFRADQVLNFLIKFFLHFSFSHFSIIKFHFPFFASVIGLLDGTISYRDHFSVPIFQCLQCASNYDLSKIQ